MGNFIFLVGLEAAQAYIFSLSISSFFAGAFGYAVLPNLAFKLPFASIINLLYFLTFSAFGLIVVSATAGLVMAMILTFLSAEIILSAHSAWRKLITLRITMMLSGTLSWFLIDEPALIFRALWVSATVFIVLHLADKTNRKIQSAPRIPSLPLLSLVATNLIWVYILPLLLVVGHSQSEQKVLYIAATVCPLMYFKAQDVVFKLDILAHAEQESSSKKFLFSFAVPLALLYFITPVIQASFYTAGDILISVLFSILSLGFLVANYWLTFSLQAQRALNSKTI